MTQPWPLVAGDYFLAAAGLLIWALLFVTVWLEMTIWRRKIDRRDP